MKRIIRITLIILLLLNLSGCSQKEPAVIKTYEETDLESTEENWENNELVTLVRYYEMSDGTWKTDDHTYQYRLEITGRMGNAAKETVRMSF